MSSFGGFYFIYICIYIYIKLIDILNYIRSVIAHSINVIFGFKINFICTSVLFTVINVRVIIAFESTKN